MVLNTLKRDVQTGQGGRHLIPVSFMTEQAAIRGRVVFRERADFPFSVTLCTMLFSLFFTLYRVKTKMVVVPGNLGSALFRRPEQEKEYRCAD